MSNPKSTSQAACPPLIPQFSFGISMMVISMSFALMPQVRSMLVNKARISAFFASIVRPSNIKISIIMHSFVRSFGKTNSSGLN